MTDQRNRCRRPWSGPPVVGSVAGACAGLGLAGLASADGLDDLFSGYQSKSFTPAQVGTFAELDHRKKRGFICALREGVGRRGLRSYLDEPETENGEVVVGYHVFADYDGPRCWELVANRFRSAVQFDVDALPEGAGNALLIATLSFRRAPSPAPNPPNNAEPCEDALREVQIATTSWEPGLTLVGRDERLVTPLARRPAGGVTCDLQSDGQSYACLANRAVQSWVSNDQHNFGFVLIERDPGFEDFPPGLGKGAVYAPDTRCAHYYRDFELEVSYIVPPTEP